MPYINYKAKKGEVSCNTMEEFRNSTVLTQTFATHSNSYHLILCQNNMPSALVIIQKGSGVMLTFSVNKLNILVINNAEMFCCMVVGQNGRKKKNHSLFSSLRYGFII